MIEFLPTRPGSGLRQLDAAHRPTAGQRARVVRHTKAPSLLGKRPKTLQKRRQVCRRVPEQDRSRRGTDGESRGRGVDGVTCPAVKMGVACAGRAFQMRNTVLSRRRHTDAHSPSRERCLCSGNPPMTSTLLSRGLFTPLTASGSQHSAQPYTYRQMLIRLARWADQCHLTPGTWPAQRCDDHQRSCCAELGRIARVVFILLKSSVR